MNEEDEELKREFERYEDEQLKSEFEESEKATQVQEPAPQQTTQDDIKDPIYDTPEVEEMSAFDIAIEAEKNVAQRLVDFGAKSFSAGMDTIGNTSTFFGDFLNKNLTKISANKKRIAEIGRDGFILEERRANAIKDKKDPNAISTRITDGDRFRMDVHDSLNGEAVEVLGKTAGAIGDFIADLTRDSSINKEVEKAFEEEAKNSSTSSVNIFDTSQGTYSDRTNNLLQTLAPIATQVAMMSLNPAIAGTGIVADTEADYVKRGREIGLTEDEINENKTKQVALSSAIAFFGDKLKLGSMTKFVSKLTKVKGLAKVGALGKFTDELIGKIAETTAGKIGAVAGSYLSSGLGELYEQRTINAGLVESMNNSGRFTEEQIKKEFPEEVWYKSADFQLGGILGGLGGTVELSTKRGDIKLTDQEQKLKDAVVGNQERDAQIEQEAQKLDQAQHEKAIKNVDAMSEQDQAFIKEMTGEDVIVAEDGSISDQTHDMIEVVDEKNTEIAKKEQIKRQTEAELKELEASYKEATPDEQIQIIKKQKQLSEKLEIASNAEKEAKVNEDNAQKTAGDVVSKETDKENSTKESNKEDVKKQDEGVLVPKPMSAKKSAEQNIEIKKRKAEKAQEKRVESQKKKKKEKEYKKATDKVKSEIDGMTAKQKREAKLNKKLKDDSLADPISDKKAKQPKVEWTELETFTPKPAIETFTPTPAKVEVFTPTPQKIEVLTPTPAKVEKVKKKKMSSLEKNLTKAVEVFARKGADGDAKLSAIEQAHELFNEELKGISKSVLSAMDKPPRLKIKSTMKPETIENHVKEQIGRLQHAKNKHAKHIAIENSNAEIKRIKDLAKKKSKGDSKLSGMNKEIVKYIESKAPISNQARNNVLRKINDEARLSPSEAKILNQLQSNGPDLNQMTREQIDGYNVKLKQLSEGSIEYADFLQRADDSKMKWDIAKASYEFDLHNAGDTGKGKSGFAKSIVANHTDPERLINRTFGEDSSAVENTFHKVVNADNNNVRLTEESDAQYEKDFPFMTGSKTGQVSKSLVGADNAMDVMQKPSIPFNGEKITINQAMDVYALSKSESGMQTLVNSGWSDGDIASLNTTLDSKYRDAVDNHMEYLQSTVYDRSNATRQRLHGGTSMGKIENYHPAMGLKDTTTKLKTTDDMRNLIDADGKVNDKFTNARQLENSGFESVNDLGYFQKIAKLESDSNRYSTHTEALDEVSKFLSSKPIRTRMEKKSPATKKAVETWLEHQITDQIADGGEMAEWEKTVFRAKNRVITSAFGSNVWIPAKQAGSIPLALPHIEARYWKDIATSAVSMDAHKFANESSALMSSRSSKKLLTELGMEAKRIEGAVNSKVKRGINKAVAVADEIADTMTKGIGWIDKGASVGVWTSKYNEMVGNGKTHAQAVKGADKVVRKTQPKFGNNDVPAVARKKWLSLFRPFASAITQNFNIIGDVVAGGKQGDSVGKRAGQVGVLMAEAGIIMAINEARNLVRWNGEDDKDKKKFGVNDSEFKIDGVEVFEGLTGLFTGAVPFASSIVSEVQSEANEGSSYEKQRAKQLAFSPVQGISKVLVSSTSLVKALMSGDEKARDKALRKFKDGAGQTTGMAVNNIGNTTKDIIGLYRAVESRLDPTSRSARELRWAMTQIRQQEVKDRKLKRTQGSRVRKSNAKYNNSKKQR